MSRNYVFAPEEYYHIYARGFEKNNIFRNTHDYRRFLESVYLFNSETPINFRDIKNVLANQIRGLTPGDGNVFAFDRGESIVDIGAYCLMPNHFHMLIREKGDDGKGISKFMQKLMTSYTMYFNKTYERTGALFGSSFKAQHVVDDVHLKYLFAYIHLNPRSLHTRKHKRLEEYTYSSYPDYLGTVREQNTILNTKVFPDYFSASGMKKEIESWLSAESDLSHKTLGLT